MSAVPAYELRLRRTLMDKMPKHVHQAEVPADLVDLWRVYVDNKPVYKLTAHDG